MNRALLVIDYTNDFVADEGALTCGKAAQALDPFLTHLSRGFIDQGQLLVYGVDIHEDDDLYHPETKLFPPHNIRGSEGRHLYGKTGDVYTANADNPSVLHIDKTRYSAFAGTNLDMKLRERGVTELHLTGVCTDICVLHTAVDAYNLGYSLTIYREGTASFNEAGHAWALSHFETTLGAKVI